MNRRKFVSGFLATSTALSWSGLSAKAQAASAPLKLSVVSRTIDVNGKAVTVFGFIGPDGKNSLSLQAGQTASVDLTNTLKDQTLVHWHGLAPQWQFDGVPDLPMPMLNSGETRSYDLPGGTGGTHWMHAHTLQEQNLLAAPLIVHRPEDAQRDEQEVVIILHDFSFTPAELLLAKLKKGSSMASMPGMNMNGMGKMANMPSMDHSKMSGGMGHMMMGMDLNDIDYDAYLANDRTLEDPQVTQVEKGGKVRLRIINGATGTAFFIDTGTLKATVAAVDGQDVEPLTVKQFPLSMGQRVDLMVSIPKEGGAFPILALREGAKERTGIILAAAGANIPKLASKSGKKAGAIDLSIEAQLRSKSPLAIAKTVREFQVELSGSMEGYNWSLNMDSPLEINTNSFVQIRMQNNSMMAHPMHLHGHHFQVVSIDDAKVIGAVRDTVFLPPMARVSVVFQANNPGKAWPFHCHHLYHMASGMMTTIGYSGA